MRSLACALALATLFGGADAHGRMTRLRTSTQTVWTRKGPGYENNPVRSNKSSQFICRNSPKKPQITIVAGNTIEVEWTFTANHLGDGALYLSYGDDKFFKIANFPEMNLSNNQFHTVNLPAWLPSAEHAVLRWEWYALHVFPTIEFYVQCTDVKIKAGSSPRALSAVKALSYSVVSPSTLPDNGLSSSGAACRSNGCPYRDGFNPTTWWQAGDHKCVDGVVGNCCEAAESGLGKGYNYGDGGYNSCANSGSGATRPKPTPMPVPTARPTPGPTYPTPVPVVVTRAPTPAASRRRRTSSVGAGYVCPPNSYIFSERWPIQDLSDCQCAWGFVKGADSCIKPGAAGASPTPRPPPAVYPTPAPRPTPRPASPTPSPTPAPATAAPAPNPSGAPYACPAGSYISSQRWPILDFSDCKCNWGYTRLGDKCGTNGVAFSAAAQVKIAAPPPSEIEVLMAKESKPKRCRKRTCKFKCPDNSYLTSKRWFKGSLSAAKDCACNPGYTWSDPVADPGNADKPPQSQGVCVKIMTEDKVKAGEYACPDNSYISSDRWPLKSFDDCACANGFRRVSRYERCDTRSKLEEKFVTHLTARVGGFDSVADFMRKAHNFKRNVAAAVGAAEDDVVIDNVAPIEADDESSGIGGRRLAGRRHLTVAAGQLEVEYSMLAAMSDQSADIEARLAATADFKDATVARVYSPIVEDAELPENSDSGGGVSPDLAVVLGACGFCALVVAGALVAVRNSNARFARMGGPTPGLPVGGSQRFNGANPMFGTGREPPARPPPRPAVPPPRPAMADMDQGSSTVELHAAAAGTA